MSSQKVSGIESRICCRQNIRRKESADHDSKHAVPLLRQIDIEGSNILGDKAYGAKAIRDYIASQNASYTIPPRENCDTPWPVDWYSYKERHLIECFFQKLKWFRIRKQKNS